MVKQSYENSRTGEQLHSHAVVPLLSLNFSHLIGDDWPRTSADKVDLARLGLKKKACASASSTSGGTRSRSPMRMIPLPQTHASRTRLTDLTPLCVAMNTVRDARTRRSKCD